MLRLPRARDAEPLRPVIRRRRPIDRPQVVLGCPALRRWGRNPRGAGSHGAASERSATNTALRSSRWRQEVSSGAAAGEMLRQQADHQGTTVQRNGVSYPIRPASAFDRGAGMV